MKEWWQKRNKREKRLITIGLAIFVYVVLDFSMNFGHYKKLMFDNDTAAAQDLAAMTDSLQANNQHKKSKPPVPYAPENWQKDPFRGGKIVQVSLPMTAPEAVKKQPSFHLQAISISPFNRMALINGHIVREGDWLGSARVTRIWPGKVELRFRDGQRLMLRLP